MGEPRTLRSKRLRAILYYAAQGRCALCGNPLGDDWEADHIVPWSLTRQTSVHDMQALCRACNRRKGTMMLRAHQQAFDDVCKRILHGEYVQVGHTPHVYVSVTPGGGKSLLPIIAAHRLIPSRFEKICWVVPRTSLAEQAERNFVETDLRAIVPHRHMIRLNDNTANPPRDTIGYVTTYQAIAANPMLHIEEFSRRRYILFLDEPHHIAETSPSRSKMAELIRRAGMVVYASGTWTRGDRRPVAFIPYAQTDRGLELDMAECPEIGRFFVRYSRARALEESAIIPVSFVKIDGRAEWYDRDGERQQVDSIAECDDEDTAYEALTTALHTDYAKHLLDRCVADWQAYQKLNPSAKLLVVSKKIETAREQLAYLKAIGVRAADIATSGDEARARAAINRFKEHNNKPGSLSVLVTVAMAYEGLDVPSITHIACLTHYRSRPWIEQMIARGVRVDRHAGPVHEQRCYVYGPDDKMLQDCLREILNEQESVLSMRQQMMENLSSDGDTLPDLSTQIPILPIASVATRERSMSLVDGEQLDYDEHAKYAAVLSQAGLQGKITPLDVKHIVRQLESPSPPTSPQPPEIVVTPSQEEKQLKHEIDRYTRTVDLTYYAGEWGSCNREIRRMWLRPRAEMTIEELRRVWQWLIKTYPRQ